MTVICLFIYLLTYCYYYIYGGTACSMFFLVLLFSFYRTFIGVSCCRILRLYDLRSAPVPRHTVLKYVSSALLTEGQLVFHLHWNRYIGCWL